jgi:hypothetical protein
MAENKKRYVVNGVRYNIPEAEVESFERDNPNAVPVNSYMHNDSIYHVPINDLDGFLQSKPDARLVDGSKKKVSSQGSATKEEKPPAGSTPESLSQTDGFRTSFEKGEPSTDAGKIDQFYKDPRTQEQIAKGEYGEAFGDNVVPPGSSFEYITQAGAGNSLLVKGIAYLSFMDEATKLGKKNPMDYAANKLKEFSNKNQLSLAQYEPTMVEDVASSVFGLALDSGLFAGMGSASKGALKAGGWVKNQLVGRGVATNVADKATKNAIKKHIARGAAETGFTLGQYNMLAETLRQLETSGTIEDFQEGLVLKEFGKGALLGMGVGVIGTTAGIINNSIMSRGIRNQLGRKAAAAGIITGATIAEGGLFELGGALMEGRSPTWEGLIHNAAVFGAMKAAGVPSRIKEGRRNVVDYTAEELTRIGGEAMIGKSRDQIVKDLSKDKKAFEDVLNNPDIAWTTKAKLAYEIAGVPPVNPPEVLGYNMKSVPDGRTIIETTDANGAVVERSFYNTKAEAMRDAANVDASIKEGIELRRFYDIDGEGFNAVDAGLKELGYEKGVESDILTNGLKLRRSDRTPEQQKIVDEWMELMGEVKVEEAPSIEKAGEIVESGKAKRPGEYTAEEIDLKYETTPRLEARVSHEKFGVNKMLSELDRIESEGKYEGERLRTKDMSRFFPEVEGDYLEIRSKADVDNAREVLTSYKQKATEEIARRTQAGETDAPEGKFVMGRRAFESKEELFSELDKMPRDNTGQVKVPEVLDLETMKAIDEYQTKVEKDAVQEPKAEKVDVGEPGKEVGKEKPQAKEVEATSKIYERPEMENPVHEVDVAGEKTYIQRIEGDFDQWFSVKKTDKGIWKSDKFKGFTKAEAVEAIKAEKIKGDAVQKPKTEKMDVGEPAKPGKEVGKEKPKAEEEVSYITPETSEKYADLTTTPEGDVVFFHYSPERRTVIDPKKSGTNKGAITGQPEIAAASTVGGMNYYYTNTAKVEPGVGKEQHAVRVPKEKVYDGNKDPLNFAEEAKRRFKEENPDMAFSPNHKMAWITKVAGENGFDMVVVDWAGRTRAQSTKPMTPEAEVPEARRTAEEGYTKQPPVKAEDTYVDVLQDINKHQNKKGVYDDLYHAESKYMNPKDPLYQNKEGITELVEKSDLPKDLKDSYMDALKAQDVSGRAVKSPITEQVFTHKREGGSTYSVEGKNLMGTEGTSVGIFPERTKTIKRPLEEKHIELFKEDNMDILKGNEDVLAVGTWKNSSGENILDIVAVTPREKAIELGKKYNQESVFDLAKGEEIPTGGTGKVPEGAKPEADRIQDIRETATGGPPAKEPPKPPDVIDSDMPMELPNPGKGKSLSDKDFHKEMRAAIRDFDKAIKQENKDAIRSYRGEVIERRIALNKGAYETNLLVDGINKATTKNERIAASLLLEKGGVPDQYKGTEVEKLYNNPTPALEATVKEARKYFDEAWQHIVENTDKMSVDQIENYVTHVWDIPKNQVESVAQWFSTRNKFLNKRSIETIKEGMDKFGLQPKTLDVGDIIKIHSSAARNAIENNKFVEAAKKIDVGGFPLLSKAKEAPPGWVKYEHPALSYKTIVGKDTQGRPVRMTDYYHIPVELKRHFDALFGSRKVGDARMAQAWNAYENIGNYLKKAQLSLSLFHHGALSETAVANMGLPKAMKTILYDVGFKGTFKKSVPAFQNPEIARRAVDAGVQLGAAQDFDVAKIQRQLDNLAESAKGIPGANLLTKGFAEFNRAWDRALWEYLHDGLKIYTFEHLAGKINADKMTPEQYKKQLRETAQFVNDSYGGQNWEVLGVSPMQQRIMRAFLLSPDWTVSTIRQALAPLGVGTLYKSDSFWESFKKGSPAMARRKHGTMFWLKAAMWYGAGVNLMNAAARKKDMEENPELYMEDQLAILDKSIKDVDLSNTEEVAAYLRDLSKLTMANNTIGHKTHLFDGRYEDGKERYIRWGKQFRELPELFMDESGVNFPRPMFRKLGGKFSPQVQILFQAFTGKTASGYENYDMRNKDGWEYTMGIMKMLSKSAFPFSTSSMIREDKEWRPMDLMMPSSKGMSAYKAEEYFFRGIAAQDKQYVNEVFEGAVRNNLDAYSLFVSAMNRHERTLERESTDLSNNLDELVEQKNKETDPKKKNELAVRILEIRTRQLDVEASRQSLKQAMDELDLYTKEYDKKWRRIEPGAEKEDESDEPKPKRSSFAPDLPSVKDVKGVDVEIDVEIEETGKTERMSMSAVEVRKDIKRRYDAINELIKSIG